MDARTMQPPRAGSNGSRPPEEAPRDPRTTRRWRVAWWLARWVGGFLLLTAAVLGLMWSWFSLLFAITSKLPGGVFLASGQHLVYTLDLSLLVPSFALAGALLWRRTAWGYVLATLMSVYAAVYQLNYLVASAFQVDADVAGAKAFDPAALGLTLAFLLATVLLLGNLRPAPR